MSKQVAEIDPNVRIPAAVKAAAARAEDEHKKIYSKEQPAPTDENIQPADPPAEPKQEAAVTPEGNEPSAVPPPPAPNDSESWEHRYKSMKGRYDRAEATIRQLTDRIATLESTLATVQSAPPPAPEPPAVERLITPQEEQEYGTEFLTVVAKKAREEVSPEVTELKRTVAELQKKLDSVGGRVVEDARKRMWDTLDERVPNWREVNEDQKFFAWLQLPDTYSGAIRHALLKDAYDRNDAARVLAFFNGFLAEEAAVAPQEREPDPKTPAAEPPKTPGKVPLETFAAPGRAKTAAAPAPAEKPIITRAEISSFYAAKAAGKYRGNEAEADRLERMIFEAQRDGRIQ